MHAPFLWLWFVCGLTRKSGQNNCGRVTQKTLKRKGQLAPLQEATTQRRSLAHNLPAIRLSRFKILSDETERRFLNFQISSLVVLPSGKVSCRWHAFCNKYNGLSTTTGRHRPQPQTSFQESKICFKLAVLIVWPTIQQIQFPSRRHVKYI